MTIGTHGGRPDPLGFVVHGLWPQNERGYPEFCRTSEPDRVPDPLVERYLDLLPSAGLIGHPWRKPGDGMLREAVDRLGLDVGRSIMVGDRMSDMEAAAAAGVPHRWLLEGGNVRDLEAQNVVSVGRDQAVAKLLAIAGGSA